jgi:hypothetical protein
MVAGLGGVPGIVSHGFHCFATGLAGAWVLLVEILR